MLSAGPDCGFLTARGYRAFKTGPLSRMAARREALARDITSIHGDEFMRVYGYRKVWRQLLDQGWDPLEAGRDQVARIMRELGLRGVRGGRRPVTTIPARGTGGRLDLAVFCQVGVGRFGVSFSPCERRVSGRFGVGRSCWLLVIALVIA